MSMKAKILELLREKETYVSGQELCEQFGVHGLPYGKQSDN